MSEHKRTCPAYNNYQPPYEKCTCICPYCSKPMEDTEHVVEYVLMAGVDNCIIGCPEHPRDNTMTVIDVDSWNNQTKE